MGIVRSINAMEIEEQAEEAQVQTDALQAEVLNLRKDIYELKVLLRGNEYFQRIVSHLV